MNKELSRRRIVLNGQDIEYELQRKQVKNINLRIRQDGTVYVSASPTVSLTVIEKFMQSRSGLILSAIEGAKLAQPICDPYPEWLAPFLARPACGRRFLCFVVPVVHVFDRPELVVRLDSEAHECPL